MKNFESLEKVSEKLWKSLKVSESFWKSLRVSESLWKYFNESHGHALETCFESRFFEKNHEFFWRKNRGIFLRKNHRHFCGKSNENFYLMRKIVLPASIEKMWVIIPLMPQWTFMLVKFFFGDECFFTNVAIVSW